MSLTALAEDHSVAKHPLTRVQYDLLVRAGTFEDQAVELLDGMVVGMAPQGDDHARAVVVLGNHLARRVPEPWLMAPQVPLAVSGDSAPEPDVALVQLPAIGLPRSAALVVEVAVTSQRKDLLHKPAVYAGAGVEQYWVLDLPVREVVVHTDPGPDGYATVRRLPWTTPLSVLGVDVDLAALLPAVLDAGA